MDKTAVKVMAEVCQKLCEARVSISSMFPEKPKEYLRFREIIFDCEALMAKYCDCAPIKLITGKIEEIIHE